MGKKSKTHEEFVEQVKEKVGEDYTVLGRYTKSHDKIMMRHNVCGHEWEVQAKSFLLGGSRCARCSGRMKKTTKIFKKEVFELVRSEYTVLSEYKNALTKIKMKHEKCGHEYEVKPNCFTSNGRRCPRCFGNNKKTTEQFKKEVFNLCKDEYEVIDEYVNDYTKILIKHNVCDQEWSITPNNFLRGYRCPICASSKGEKAISEYLTNNNFNFEREFKIGLDKKRFDFKIGNLILEFDGIQHFKQRSGGSWEKNSNLHKRKDVDKYKTMLALFNNYKLVRISYSELNNIDKILDFIFNNELEDLNLFGVEYSERNY